ncbi:hypothetical protein C7H84_06070 [Burkholderia sp. Nafp2/4-1b]|nr:hypothetical protein C7H84_06070 [Burkholderia sp. Nafp2/4-1b]
MIAVPSIFYWLREQQVRTRRATAAAAGLSKQDYPLPAARQQSTISCASLKKILCGAETGHPDIRPATGRERPASRR